MSKFHGDSIFWVEAEKIKPNPFQPRQEFDEAKLNDLAESIRMYGILQPLVVSRKEIETPEGGLAVEYELIAGERRLRASRIASVSQVPVLIRTAEDSDREKLELAIIENLQREDISPVDRARAFDKLVKDFKLKHHEIATKVGKSREYVTNTLRLLMLSNEMQEALAAGKISEGHTRPLLMLIDRPDEQATLYKEIILRKLNVRESELIARGIAKDRARKKEQTDHMTEVEDVLTNTLGTRVQVEPRENGGRVLIHFFTEDDLQNIMNLISRGKMAAFAEARQKQKNENEVQEVLEDTKDMMEEAPVQDDDEDLYSIKNFSI